MQPLQLGILGVSGFFKKKIAIPIQKSPLIQIAAIASRSDERAAQAAQQYGIERSYGSYEELLADSAIEAVYLPLPNNLHLEWIKKAADAGKHIVCEKPITLNSKEARECIDYAEEKGIILMEGFMYKFHPQWQHAQELIQMLEIGKVMAINVFFGYNNTSASNIRNIKEAGGGALLDIGCYAVSSCRYLLGAEPKRCISLIQRDPDFETDVLSSGILDFGITQATFTVGTQVFPYQRVVVHGSSGNITIEIPYNAYNDTASLLTITNSVGTRQVAIDPTDQYILEFEGFTKAIREKELLPAPAEDAFFNMKVLDALFRSEKSGDWERI